MFISCEEAHHNCDKSQYKEASFFERIKLTIHLIYCRACRKYSSKNAKLTEFIKMSRVECLDAAEKENLEAEFNKALSNK